MTTEDKIKKIIAEQLGVDEEEVTSESLFVQDLKADSLDLTEMIMTVEDEFEIEIDEKAAEKLRSVGDLINFIAEKKTA